LGGGWQIRLNAPTGQETLPTPVPAEEQPVSS